VAVLLLLQRCWLGLQLPRLHQHLRACQSGVGSCSCCCCA
jgi:hypothetical protein